MRRTNNVMHIVGGLDSGGAENMLLNLLKYKNSSDVWIFLCFGKEREFQLSKKFEKHGGRIVFIPYFKFGNIVANTTSINHLVRDYRINIIHIHTLLQAGYLSLLFKLFFVKSKIIIHAHSSKDNSQGSGSILRRTYERISLHLLAKYGDSFLSCSHQATDYLFEFVDKTEVVLFKNSIDVPMFRKRIESIDDNVIKVLMVGRLEQVKNHKFALALAKKMKCKKINYKLDFVGEGSMKAQINRSIENQSLTNYVSLLGYSDDMPSIYSEYHVLIMPSYFEGFPMTLLETQASGLPAIVSENIDRSVNLGLGLIVFKDISRNSKNLERWIDEIISLSNKLTIPSCDQINAVFNQSDYSAEQAEKKLQRIYMEVKNEI